MAKCQNAYTRARKAQSFLHLQQLRHVYGDEITAQALGLTKVSLNWQRQPAPVWRLATLLHRLTFHPGEPFTILDLLSAGEFDRNKGLTPQQVVMAMRQAPQSLEHGDGI